MANKNKNRAAEPVLMETADSSHTLSLPSLGETYHSRFGAIQESLHVFIRNGFLTTEQDPLHILEVGFGTGLNALLTLLEARRQQRTVHYTALELYPLKRSIVTRLNYCRLLEEADESLFLKMHDLPWDREHLLTESFTLLKLHDDLTTCHLPGTYDLVYFDAFSAEVQPEMWSPEIFARTGKAMAPGGILVTYAAKGAVRRALQENGFRVEKPAGPPGKREMIRAVKESPDKG